MYVYDIWTHSPVPKHDDVMCINLNVHVCIMIICIFTFSIYDMGDMCEQSFSM